MPEQILLAGELDQAKVAPVAPTRELAFQAAPVMGGGVVVSKIRESLEFFTAQLASRMREQLGGRKRIDIDTCAAAFALLEDSTMCLPTLGGYSLIYVDEVSQMNAKDFERIIKLWSYVDKAPALVFSGDKHQMSGYGDERPWHSNLWVRVCKEKYLSRAYRSKIEYIGTCSRASGLRCPSGSSFRIFAARVKHGGLGLRFQTCVES